MIINLGDAPFKAFITVTYPNGTCTVSLGDKSFTHSGGGTHTFTVNKKGTWTVKATSADGYNLTTTSTAALTYRGQVASVTLRYTLHLYNSGDERTGVTGGWSFGGTGVIGQEKRASTIYLSNYDMYGSWIITNWNINLSSFSTLYVRLASGSSTGGMTFTYSAGSASTSATPYAGTFSLNIASISSGQVKINANGYWRGDMVESYNSKIEIAEVYVQ